MKIVNAIYKKDSTMQKLISLKNAIYKRKAQLDAEEAEKKAKEAGLTEVKQTSEEVEKPKEEAAPVKEKQEAETEAKEIVVYYYY